MKPKKIRRHHLDKRAAELAAVPGDDDELLTPKQLNQWLGTTYSWAANGRTYGYGPPFEHITPKMVGYRRGRVRAWLPRARPPLPLELRPAPDREEDRGAVANS